MIAVEAPTPFDPAACTWEFGGVAEVEPAPCADPYMSRLAGGGLAVVGFGIVFQLVLLAVLVGIALRLRHA